MAEYTQLREPYSDVEQQHDAGIMGMYLFIATEGMLFGGLFIAAFVLRWLHPSEYVETSRELHIWIGAINTAILLTSSLLVAIAVEAGRAGREKRAALSLAGAALLGIGFLGMKAYEYSAEYTEGVLPSLSDPARFSSPAEHQFMDLYLIATSLHGLHLTIGIILMFVLAWRIHRRGLRLPGHAIVVETSGLYWHFVDVIWIFLYPVLYLAR